MEKIHTKKSIWLNDIEIATGLAILLVVFGHFHSGELPESSIWYTHAKNYIYSFHMSFFMFLSGIIMQHSYKRFVGIHNFFSFLLEKFNRLIIPFIIFGVLIIFGKYILHDILYIENARDNFFHALREFIITPSKSSAGSLWYIYVLFQYYIIFSFILLLSIPKRIIITVLFVILYFLELPSIYMLNKSSELIVFFSIGTLTKVYYEQWSKFIDRFWKILFTLFLISLSLIPLNIPIEQYKFIIGLLSIPSIHGLIRNTPLIKNKLLQHLGKYSFIIYLLNTITIGVTKALMVFLFGFNGIIFNIFIPIFLIAGTYFPILIKRNIIKFFPKLDKLTS